MKRLLTTSLILFFSAASQANSTGSELNPFILSQWGYQFLSDTANGTESGLVAGITAGVYFHERFAIDLGYQWNESVTNVRNNVRISNRNIETGIRYLQPFNERLNGFARIGIDYWQLKKNTTKRSDSANGVAPLFEWGLAYQLTPHWAASLSHKYVHGVGDSKTGEYNANQLLLGFSYQFAPAELNLINSPSAQPQTKAPKVEPYHNQYMKYSASITEKSTVQTALATATATATATAENLNDHQCNKYIYSLYFPIDSSYLSPHQMHDIKDLEKELKQLTKPYTIQVIGYADTSTGTTKYNDWLAKRRYSRTAELLKSEGLPIESLMSYKLISAQGDHGNGQRVDLILSTKQQFSPLIFRPIDCPINK